MSIFPPPIHWFTLKMLRPCVILSVAGLALAVVQVGSAAVGRPYNSDSNTPALYHFDEAPGAADTGNPIANYGAGGAALDLTNSVNNLFGVGTTTRTPFRFETDFVDEARISSVARGADEFIFIPPPQTGAILGIQ